MIAIGRAVRSGRLPKRRKLREVKLRMLLRHALALRRELAVDAFLVQGAAADGRVVVALGVFARLERARRL
jgi:hypothetical protein